MAKKKDQDEPQFATGTPDFRRGKVILRFPSGATGLYKFRNLPAGTTISVPLSTGGVRDPDDSLGDPDE